jgi:hypothetical protein
VSARTAPVADPPDRGPAERELEQAALVLLEQCRHMIEDGLREAELAMVLAGARKLGTCAELLGLEPARRLFRRMAESA